MKIHDYDPAQGQAFQGDIAIIPIPKEIGISTVQEIAPVKGRLILQEGEVSGHHHAIELRQRNFQALPAIAGDPLMATRSPKLRKALGGIPAAATARMYRDDEAVATMVSKGILARADLAVACLVIEGGPMSVTHEEHDGIRLPIGRYLIGRQIESAGAEERVVRD
jgi:hypothetical protein